MVPRKLLTFLSEKLGVSEENELLHEFGMPDSQYSNVDLECNEPMTSIEQEGIGANSAY